MSLILVVTNDGTGTHKAANYDWRVLINRDQIASGRVEGHDRAAGWPALVRRIVEPCLCGHGLETHPGGDGPCCLVGPDGNYVDDCQGFQAKRGDR